MLIRKSPWLFLLFILFSCIDPYAVEVEEGVQLLTVDGMVTSGKGPHVIRLTRSDTYGSVYEGLVRPVANATVIVRDNEGGVTYFSEDKDDRGMYYSSEDFSAILGRSYTLQIQLPDGKVYTSLPEKIDSEIAIQDIYFQSETIPVEGEINLASGVGIYVDVEDPAGQNNFYYWRNGPSVYELHTRPDLYVNRETRAPAPKDCCNLCYVQEEVGNYSVFLSNDDVFDGLSTRMKAGFIPDDGLRFVTTFRVDLKQLSITAGAYRFLRLVKQQVGTSGSVFDPPPANIRGNMISLDNPNEVVLGYFMAAGEVEERIYINGADLDFRQQNGLIPDDCRVVDNTTIDPPADWLP